MVTHVRLDNAAFLLVLRASIMQVLSLHQSMALYMRTSRAHKKRLLIVLLVVVNTLLAVIALRGVTPDAIRLRIDRSTARSYPEVDELSRSMTFHDLSSFFQRLTRTKGPEYAYEVLRYAKLPDNTDLHLLGHVVGDELFRKYGASGMKFCTDEFRNACSHAIVVGLYLSEGERALEKLDEACRKAPGGTGAYTMCYHGLGHGVLAASGYDLEKAVGSCEKIGDVAEGTREFPECVGGAIMELTSGGFHDVDLWAAQVPKYFQSEAPFAPCSTDLIPYEAKELCFEYLTPHLVRVVGGDIAAPSDDHLERAMELCARIPEPIYQSACYRSFGKEFVVLVAKRDIRSLEAMSDEELTRIYDLCQLARDTLGIRMCMTHAVDSLFWGGENDRKLSERFCALVTNDSDRSACFSHLIGAVHFYIKDNGIREVFCRELPADFRTTCVTWSEKFGV